MWINNNDNNEVLKVYLMMIKIMIINGFWNFGLVIIIIRFWKFGLMIVVIMINRFWKCELIIMIIMKFWKFGLMTIKIMIINRFWNLG